MGNGGRYGAGDATAESRDPSINCEDVHPEIETYAGSIPHVLREMPGLNTVIKAGFGFGDVNACTVFRRWAD